MTKATYSFGCIFFFENPQPMVWGLPYTGGKIPGGRGSALGCALPGVAMKDKGGILLIAERGYELAGDLDGWARENGYQLVRVDNIKDVLMTLQQERVNVLVLDACLPEEMGYESISIIKGLCHKLPIIVAADVNNPELESRIRQKGIFYYHVKSFGLEELMLAITNAMERSSH
jgi:DNA-binding NtrC family response regulator